MILVDTSVWIDFFNGVDSAERGKLSKLIIDNAHIGITDLIITEILQGIRSDDQFEKVKSTILQLPIQHPVPIKTYLHAAEIYRQCREKGFTIRKTNDCLIAAVTIETESTLLHKDKDFTAIAQCVSLEIMVV